MRERARDKGRLEDIIEYSENIIELMSGVTYSELITDKRTYYAVMKNIEIVGEAAYMLTKAFKEAYPETPWRVIQGMRNILVHDYTNVLPATLYDTAINGIPELKQQIEKYLANINWEEWESVKDNYDEIVDPIYENNVKAAKKMKADGMATELIAKYTGLSDEEIATI